MKTKKLKARDLDSLMFQGCISPEQRDDIADMLNIAEPTPITLDLFAFMIALMVIAAVLGTVAFIMGWVS